jgi:hypothetical protein
LDNSFTTHQVNAPNAHLGLLDIHFEGKKWGLRSNLAGELLLILDT